MTPQGTGSSVGLKYLGPQNFLQLIKRQMRRSSEVLVPHADSFFLMSLPLLVSSQCHFDWLSTIIPILPPPVSLLFPTSSLTGPPVALPLLILLYSSCYHIMPALQYPESPGLSCPQLKCQPLQHTSLPASTSSVPGLLQRTTRSAQLIKAPKVTEQFHYEAEGTEVLRPDPQLSFFTCRRLLS